MSIPVDTQCLQCFLKRNLELVRTLGTEQQAMAFAKELMKLYLNAPEDVASPWFGPAAADLLHEMYGLPLDRFREEKEFSDRFVLERMDQIRQKVLSAPDPVDAGLQFSILGNYLDFSALQGQVSFERLDDMLSRGLEMELDMENYRHLCRDLEAGKKLLYLTDNAGEIGFDRLFAEEIGKKYPHLEITFCVRGDVAQNDATREDAAAVGIAFPVIDNGNRVAGTQLDQLSGQAREALKTADVIIAKGMANTETMFGCGYNVYYAFLIKCQRFVTVFGRDMFTPMLVRDGQKYSGT